MKVHIMYYSHCYHPQVTSLYNYTFNGMCNLFNTTLRRLQMYMDIILIYIYDGQFYHNVYNKSILAVKQLQAKSC